jgi:cytochrome c biogenesis protein CcmG/thiol:disulfide interchange protein DsbE
MRNRSLPLFVFICLVALLAAGLTLNPRVVPSPLIERPAPVFSLPQVHDAAALVGSKDMLGQVVLLNVWASWCISCRLEHGLFVKLAKSGEVQVYGLNYKDKREDALRWLDYYGDPYVASALDANGQTGIDFGVYGVPETFVIDGDGIIRYKHIGPIDEDTLHKKIVPLVRELKGRST